MSNAQQPPGWYPAQGDAEGTVRWWDGEKWVGGPQERGAQQQAGYVAPGAGMLANGRELADPWMRIAATVIDVIITSIPFIPFVGIVMFQAFEDGDAGLSYGAGLLIAGLSTAYYVIMNSLFSGTVGKLVLGLRIVDEQGNEPLGWNVGIMRTLNRIVALVSSLIPTAFISIPITLVLFLIAVASLVLLFSDAQHRTVMDQFAKTYVVKAK